jgi:predicted transposase YbfD/YdcC
VHAVDGAGEVSLESGALKGLLEILLLVTDPRKRRGVRHRLAGIVAVAVAATVTGVKSFTAIGEWADDAGPVRLAKLGITSGVPSESTIRRCLQRLDADGFDRILGAWMWLRTSTIKGRRVISFDGKTVRGARDTAGNLVHLMAGLCHNCGAVIGQMSVGAKTNEVPVLTTLLDRLAIAGTVVIADAMHTVKSTAEYLTGRGAHYVFTVKRNQPNLRKQLKSLPWKKIPALHTDRCRGHGRSEQRSIQATEIAAGIAFPGAVQALRITRKVTERRKGKVRTYTETVYAVTSLSATEATPEQIAGWLRSHWKIETQLHWVRDVTFGEDLSQIRTGSGPQVMASLRNLVLSLLRLDGHTEMAATLRHYGRDLDRPIELLLAS